MGSRLTLGLIIFLCVNSTQEARAGGGLTFDLYLPKKIKMNAPLVVLLHGCDQTAAEFANVTKMNSLADQAGFAILYPEQNRARNHLGCWNWFNAEGQGRTANEASQILAIIDKVSRERKLGSKVFIAGLSAGGAMAGYLATCYPKRFSAAAIHSGASFLRAKGPKSALKLMSEGSKDLAQKKRCPSFQRKPLLVIHGTEDTIVNPMNATLLINDLSTKKPKSARLMISGLGHAWSGGVSNMKYSDPQSPHASSIIWEFFRGIRAR